jgi:multisubunit Na+/H+ antiporter MnhG subunit
VSGHSIAIVVLLAMAASFCVIGAIGMWCMRRPTQAVNYMALPSTAGILCITIALFLQTGFSSAAVKCAAIVIILVSINSVVTHATARAFYVRNQDRGKQGHPEWDFSRQESE